MKVIEIKEKEFKEKIKGKKSSNRLLCHMVWTL